MRKRRIGKAVLAGILSLSLLPFPGVTAHGEEAGVNRMLDAVVTTSSNETANLNGDKVKDGKFERTDRWASGYEVPTTNIWLKAEFEEATEIRQIDIYFFERDVAPMPSNVQSFSIKYTDEAGEEHYLEKDYENQQEDGGYADQVSILQRSSKSIRRDMKKLRIWTVWRKGFRERRSKRMWMYFRCPRCRKDILWN